eukprot:1387838-Prymnesium_polylepis.1
MCAAASRLRSRTGTLKGVQKGAASGRAQRVRIVQQQPQVLARCLEHGRQDRLFSHRERLQHKIGHVVPAGGPADANPQAPKVLAAQRLLARQQAAMAAGRASELELHLAQLEIEIIMAHEDARRGQRVLLRELHNAAARRVHERERPDEERVGASQLTLRDQRARLAVALPRSAQHRHDPLQQHRAGVVARRGVLLAGVAQADGEQGKLAAQLLRHRLLGRTARRHRNFRKATWSTNIRTVRRRGPESPHTHTHFATGAGYVS